MEFYSNFRVQMFWNTHPYSYIEQHDHQCNDKYLEIELMQLYKQSWHLQMYWYSEVDRFYMFGRLYMLDPVDHQAKSFLDFFHTQVLVDKVMQFLQGHDH